MKFLETLTKLGVIVALIRNPNFVATQAAIGDKIGCTDRMVRHYFDVLSELEAPLVNHGRMGWELEEGWDLSAAMKKYQEKNQ